MELRLDSYCASVIQVRSLIEDIGFNNKMINPFLNCFRPNLKPSLTAQIRSESTFVFDDLCGSGNIELKKKLQLVNTTQKLRNR